MLSLINNHARPRDSEYLRSAEEVARGVVGFGVMKNGVATPVPRITRDLRLPAFGHSRSDPWAWPSRPERPVDYSIAAGSLRADKAGASTERQTEEEAVARAEV